ncbi:hypothetical protein AB6A40_009534 [Gnathostoma spinigerum]|uniref:Deoxyhypusine hydroxylase n=1 Tax=Gnathostoma spinigerum TaxID=75299 RepID=A0ABD6ETG8_9BILA
MKASSGDEVVVEHIDRIGSILNDREKPLKARFRALFSLRNIGCERSVIWIAKCFSDPSALLKHELAYCLGQTRNKAAIPILKKVLEDSSQEVIVRHEAAEGLGAIGDESAVPTLLKYKDDKNQAIAETCQLALQRIEWEKNHQTVESDEDRGPYDSVDPAPASTEKDVHVLGHTLIDLDESLWNRYRSMFALRNLNTDESIRLLAKGLQCKDSALFRHEVAYVLGQAQSSVCVDELRAALENENEDYMVRHECAEALGAIATNECEAILQKYINDSERVVRESCEVALDMAEYEKDESFQYATIPA